MWSEAVDLFLEYMGTGLIVIWYLISLIYLLLREKRKDIRILFIYVPIILLLLYFNPLFVRLVIGIVGGEIYYRILWLLPITVVIAYTCTCIYGELNGRRRELFAFCAVGLMILSGSFIYSNPNFHRAENQYHVPSSVVEICDAINVPGREVMAVFPLELVQYVRQYSPVTCMPYGREMLITHWDGIWGYSSELCDVMEQNQVSLEELVPLTREEGCHYIVLRRDKEVVGNRADYGWELFFETEEYLVYRDTGVALIIPEGYAGK